MIKKITKPDVVPHFQISDEAINQIDVHEYPNKSSTEVVTLDSNGGIIDSRVFKRGDTVVVIAPVGKWGWFTSNNGTKYRKLFTMPSVAPDNFRINLTINGLKAPETWNRWIKVS